MTHVTVKREHKWGTTYVRRIIRCLLRVRSNRRTTLSHYYYSLCRARKQCILFDPYKGYTSHRRAIYSVGKGTSGCIERGFHHPLNIRSLAIDYLRKIKSNDFATSCPRLHHMAMCAIINGRSIGFQRPKVSQ